MGGRWYVGSVGGCEGGGGLEGAEGGGEGGGGLGAVGVRIMLRMIGRFFRVSIVYGGAKWKMWVGGVGLVVHFRDALRTPEVGCGVG